MTTRWLNQDQQRAWVRFVAVLELLPRALDGQLERDERLTHYDYFCLAMLSEAPGRRMRMSRLAGQTNATLARLSRVMTRLEDSGLVRRESCPDDRRASDIVLTDAGRAKLVAAAPGHVHTVRSLVVDVLTDEELRQLDRISERLLSVLDPDHRVMASVLGSTHED